MSYLIAVSGKGGVGKTTISGLIVAGLIGCGRTPVLALDADPNSCLDMALGVRVLQTVGGVREEARQIAGQGMAAGISKQALLELKIQQSLVEADNFDLIAMGRPEGPGCYCYANNVLKAVLGEIAAQYPYVVLDNEAGLENLARRIVQKVDLFVMVTDAGKAGITTVDRLHALAKEMGIVYDRLAIVVNRLHQDQLPEAAIALAERIGAHSLLGLLEDPTLAKVAEAGISLFSLADDHPLRRRIDGFLEDMIA